MAQNTVIFLEQLYKMLNGYTQPPEVQKHYLLVTSSYHGVPIVGVPRDFLYSESPHREYKAFTNGIRTPTILTQLILATCEASQLIL